eukprot:4252803-Prymnesium_polylepis.2
MITASRPLGSNCHSTATRPALDRHEARRGSGRFGGALAQSRLARASERQDAVGRLLLRLGKDGRPPPRSIEPQSHRLWRGALGRWLFSRRWLRRLLHLGPHIC